MRFLKTFFALALLITLSTNSSFSQIKTMETIEDVAELSTWENDRYQIFIGGHINFGSVTDAFKSSYGLGLGMQKKYFFVGLFGEMGDLGDVQMKTGEMRSTHYGIVGPWIGVRTNPNKKLGFYGSVKGGTGYGNYSIMDGEGEDIEDPDNIHVIRPEAGLELKLGKSLNIAGHLGYDFTSSIHEFPAIEDTDLRKLNFGLTLRIMTGRK